MVNIIYRHYKPGDESQLAELFVRAFQMNGASFIRTPKTWLWRYAQSPNFEPEQCQIAEDTDNGRIVGAVYANLIEKIPLGGKKYLVGDINDVSCDPDYTGRGIAKKLMNMAIEYMKRKSCDFSILTADYNGFPRKRMYLKMGYKDVDRQFIFFNFPYIPKLIKDIPIMLAFFPIVFSLFVVPRILNRIRVRLNPFFSDFSYEIQYNRKHSEYLKAINNIAPKYYEGFPKYSKEKFLWARIKVPVERYKPTYIFIKKGKKVIGGAAISHQNMYSFKFGIKVRLAVIHEWFLDEKIFKNERDLHFGYIYLIDKILKAAAMRKIGGMYFMVDSSYINFHRALKSLGFIKFKGGAVMIKIMKEGLEIPKFKKPLFIPTYVSTGVP